MAGAISLAATPTVTVPTTEGMSTEAWPAVV
jgi:hypothetical protein